MTSETRTLVELRDITAIEFSCPHCTAKILYPFDTKHGRLATNCPSCNESWLLPNGPNMHPTAKTILQEMLALFAALQTAIADTRIAAKIRLQVAPDVPQGRTERE